MSGSTIYKSLAGVVARPVRSQVASSSRLVSSSASRSASPTSNLPTPSTPTTLSFPNVPPLPHTNHHTATLTLHAHHPYALDLYTSFAYHTAQSLKIPTTRPAFLPTSKALYTVLKGPFVHKKAQENFEKRTHRRVLKVYDTEKEVLDLWLRYLKKNSIGGVGMKAQIWESLEFGYAAKEGEMVNLVQGGKKSEEDIEKAAQALVRELTGEAPQVEGAKSEAAKSEAVESETVKSEVGKSEAGKPEAGKPEAGKPEAGKPEAST